MFERFRDPLEVRDVPDPGCPSDGVVVRVEACGVCRSDWHGWTGADPDVTPPHIPGHEWAGVVEEVGPGCHSFAPGHRVTAPFILACGRCPACLSGHPTVCPDQHVVGFTGPGAFAERVGVPRADFNVVRLPDDVPFVAAAALGCRFTTAFRALVDRAGLGPGEWLAVHGCGGVGLSAVLIGAALGAPVVAVDLDPEKLALAEKIGASAVVGAAGSTPEEVGDAVRVVTGGGAQVSVDAVGITPTFHASLRSLAPLGRHVQIGMPTGPDAAPTVPLLELVYARQLTLHGTRGMAASRFPALFRMMASGRLDPGRLVGERIALEEAGTALAEMDGYGGLGITVIDELG